MNKNNLYHQESRILTDTCAVSARDTQNNIISGYSTYNYFKGNTDNCDVFDKQPIIDAMIDTQMHILDGYGSGNKCVIDEDSEIKNNPKKITHFRDNQQLFTRIFAGIPNLNHGGLVIPVEDRLLEGDVVSSRKGCDNLGEKTWDTLMPLIPCLARTVQTDKTCVPDFQNNVPTRDLIQQQEFLKGSGYQFQDGIWQKKFCAFQER
jgi:hypothetical protein